MSTIKNYSIIENEWIKSQIRFLEHQQKLKNYEDEKINFKLEYLKSVDKKLKPLTPIIDKTINKIYMFCCEDKDFKNSKVSYNAKEDYINNTIIE
jgi:uncharacterized protein YllA (UPF0747 family)